MRLLLNLLFSTIAVLITSYLLPGVDVVTFGSALIVAIVLGLLNITIKPLLIILTIPVTLLTLGLFLLVINAIIILIADGLISGFYVDGFFWALIFSIIISLLQSLFSVFVPERRE
ncbi:MAG TPA: phage holin family protein [Cytophagales bacterium]|nr:phage holin family protein [Cytophagales bacterium]